MRPGRLAALALAAWSLPAQAISPHTQELMALDRKLARTDCLGRGMALENIVASGAGDGARVRAIEAEARKAESGEAPLRTRRSALLDGKMPEADAQAYREFRDGLREACPFATFKAGGVPRNLPPATSPEEARRYVTAFVPLVLAKWRLCEVLDPKRKGDLERGWAASRFSKLDMPEMQAMAADVRAWMKDGVKVHPESRLAKEGGAQEIAHYCTAEADLKRVEAAMPPGFLK